MIILWIACFVISVVWVIAGIGKAFRAELSSSFFYLFFGVIGTIFSALSIYSEVSPEYKEMLNTAKEIEFQKAVEECDPQFKMIKKPFYGEEYVFFCLDNTELSVSEKQYESINLEVKDYEKTEIDKNFHLIILATMIFIVVPAAFYTSKFVFGF
ncbi:hypothetical protein GKR75_07835 [Providencia sp. wls1919]|nr:hypothetical protein [Providencia sp. wls1919]